jgi:hypothetical protein
MKLAEALAERSDCQVKIDEIRKRLIRSARVQEGEQPAEDTTELLAESERVFARLLELVSAINRGSARRSARDMGLASRPWNGRRLRGNAVVDLCLQQDEFGLREPGLGIEHKEVCLRAQLKFALL